MQDDRMDVPSKGMKTAGLFLSPVAGGERTEEQEDGSKWRFGVTGNAWERYTMVWINYFKFWSNPAELWRVTKRVRAHFTK